MHALCGGLERGQGRSNEPCTELNTTTLPGPGPHLRVACPHSLIQVVKEDAAQTAHLPAVLDVEVLVAPLLELGVVAWVMAVAHLRSTAANICSWVRQLQCQVPRQQ